MRIIPALLPAIFFAAKVAQYHQENNLPNVFWFCNLANLVLTFAMLGRIQPLLIACTGLLLIGTPVWIFDALVNHDFHWLSILTHVVSPSLGLLFALQGKQTRMAPVCVILFFFISQVLARLLTPEALNINVAFAVYEPVRSVFSNYWLYLLLNYAGLSVFVAVIQAGMNHRVAMA